jgi:hypothetical protein
MESVIFYTNCQDRGTPGKKLTLKPELCYNGSQIESTGGFHRKENPAFKERHLESSGVGKMLPEIHSLLMPSRVWDAPVFTQL